ncbi:GntR family transcriptional regulator [Arthrobacter jiangjiafuii]|uniref:GntR family transcriptional regulator n=2 Tax=Arthrobacter jiangjiafuii TaxID=2817475 RepID=A0A975R0X6_9MICC|nr:GntR family transcriptional regulator [Arthrobacter jiangjiafuii]MBP3044447.1 GntR family transcriptional regulator [Arthrobacter jiangjiafuii]QWC11390.1 GntR family transcriptional regulator [Arthrobacter jiangjiafuii]
MVTQPRSATLTAHVHEQLRAEILGNVFAPGSPLRLAVLSKRYGTSMSVIREALVRLTEQHLVVLLPNQGFRVTEISREDLIDVTELRIMLEGLALRRSIENGDMDWEARVVSSHHVLERAELHREGEPGTTAEWSAAHAAFHDALGTASGSQRLIGMVRGLRDSSELYRQLSGVGVAEAKRDVPAEHRELMELACDRRADEAVAALGRHLQCTTDLLLQAALAEDGGGRYN